MYILKTNLLEHIYIVLIVLKEDESMIRFVGTDTNGEVALVTAEKSNEGKYEETKSLVKDSDVIKALECCQLSNTHQVEDCDNCPFNELPQTICQNLLAYHALQIIKRTR